MKLINEIGNIYHYLEVFAWGKKLANGHQCWWCCCHKWNYSKHKELRLELQNGITMCKECHVKFHSTYGIKNNTPNQLWMFQTAYPYVEVME